MKKMKTLASLALAIVLAFALTIPVFATNQTGTITIEKPEGVDENLTYTVYQVFSMTRAENATDTTGYSYTATSAMKQLIEGAAGDYADVAEYFTFGAIAGDTANFTVTPTDTYKTEAAAKIFSQFLKANKDSLTSLTSVSFTADDAADTKTTSAIAYGYYFVDSTVGTLCMLDSFSPNVTIADKNAQPSGEKTVTVPENAKIGTDVTYHIWVEIKDGATDYVVTDTMSAGLTFKNDIAIGLADTKNGATTTQTNAATYEDQAVTGSETFKIKFLNSFLTNNVGKWIDIQYTATINNNALTVNGNTATLNYGNGHSVTFDSVTFDLYSFNLIKTDSTNTQLSGAKFKLYDAETGGNEIKVVAHEKTAEQPWDYAVTTDKTGVEIEVGNKVVFGLGNGTYYLEETEAPSGYNKLTQRVAVKFTDGQLQTVGSDGQFANSSNVSVVNQTGAELPETGGMGTTLFYTVGGLLVVCSAILFVTKKRMSNMA